MKIKKSELIAIIREVITEESEYRAYFNKVAGEKGINPNEIDKLSDAEKKSFFNAVDSGWKAQNEAYMKGDYMKGDKHDMKDCAKAHPGKSHKEWKKMEEAYMKGDMHGKKDCDKVHPGKSHKDWEKMEETLEFQQFSKGHPGDRHKARKRQQILKKPEVQEAKKSKRLKLNSEAIRKMIREELTFLMFNEVPSTKGRKRAKRNSSLLGDATQP